MFRQILCIAFLYLATAEEELFALNILHYNDFHARFVETSPAGNVCNPNEAPCVGGFARLATMVRDGFEREPQSILLNGGDSFQGTIWFNLLGWNVTQEFMNMLPHDAHVLGNHEFDNGVEFAVNYLEHLKNHTTVVTANMIDDEEPMIRDLYQPSVVVERNGRKIGIIGVIISSTNLATKIVIDSKSKNYKVYPPSRIFDSTLWETLASTGDLVFTDEVEAVKREAEILNEKGVDIIIVLSHCGIEKDREIALHGGPYIDIIVGGHSHTLLYNGDPSDTTAFRPLGPYPDVVQQDGKSILIVQAAAHLLYLGEIKLFFDSVGNLVEWKGNPHYSHNGIEQAPDVLEKINYYLPYIEELATQEIGSSLVQLSSSCDCSECNLGNLICDAFMHAAMMEEKQGDNWHYAHFCVINQGGIRSGIGSGVITYESVILSTPFENNVEVFDLRGDHIMEMLEFSVANDPFPGARMLQISGLQAVFDGARPLNDRVVNVTVRCIECDVPRYEPLQTDKYYRVVSQSFIGEGGDGFSPGIHEFMYKIWFWQQENLLACKLVVPSGRSSQPNALRSRTGYTFGMKTVFDGSRPVGSRVLDVTIRCIDCDVPIYKPLDPEKYYRMVSIDFIANGGGGYTMISNNRINLKVIGVDFSILMDYISHQTPVYAEQEGRIHIDNPCIG